MAAKSSGVRLPSTLLEELVGRTRASWLQVAVTVGLVLIGLLVAAALLAGVLAAPFDASFWRAGLLYPAIIVYILLTLPLLQRLRGAAIQAFRPLARMDDDELARLLAEAPMYNRRLEWLALGCGVVAGLLLWLIYSSLSGMRLFTGLQHHPLDIRSFDLRPLEPIGRWSLGIALAYIGGSALSLLFIPQMTLNIEAIVLYGILILTPVLVFFLNMLSTRQTIAAAKRRHLDMVGDHLAAASVALEEPAAKGQAERTAALLEAIDSWVTYEERVAKVPEWPYTAEIRRNLVLSTLLPLVVWLVREIALGLLEQLMP